jgi:DNA-binding MarR family transcriptional regulator
MLELLDRPMRGRELAEKLGLTKQRVHQLVVKLHAQGRVKLGNPNRILQIVSRTDDRTVLLARDEERVFSAIPDEYATTAAKIRVAVQISEDLTREILNRLIGWGFIEALEGLDGKTVYRVTEAGLKHPQRNGSARRAQAPRLPVESERVRRVLSLIRNARSLRIKDVRDLLKIPQDSINALMQYLKRKALVRKTGDELNAPYVLTDKGLEALMEMTRRQAA